MGANASCGGYCNSNEVSGEDAAFCESTSVSAVAAAPQTTVVDTDTLSQQLQPVEGNQAAQDALFEQLQSQGACMIVTIQVDEADELRMLTVEKYLRALFALKIWDEHVRLVKADALRFFVFATSAGRAFRAAQSMKLLLSKFDSWIGEVCPEHGCLKAPATLKAGIHHGGLLLIQGDMYGDPVNVASKLGEDIAKPNQIMVSADSAKNESDAEMQTHMASCAPKQQQTEISGLTLDHFHMEEKNLNVFYKDIIITPTKEQVDSYLNVKMADGATQIKTQELAIVTTDMSGFTRLTKKYGILHFLRLVLKARNIIETTMLKFGGFLIKYEGDNIICAFPTGDHAISCTKLVLEQITEYNKSREKDFQVRMGFGLDFGKVHLTGDDVVGSAFEASFTLAEDIAEVGEVLVTERIKCAGWPSTQSGTKLSEQKTLEGGAVKYYVLSFL